VTDLVITRGYGVFEYLRTYAGKPFRIDDHLARLARSAESIGLTLPWSRAQLHDVILDTLSRNAYPEKGIRVVVTGGESEDSSTPTGKPGLLVIVTPLRPYPQEYYHQGAKVITARIERYLPEAKTTNYVSSQVTLRQARSRDPKIIEVLYVDRHRKVTEGSRSNVFAFLGDTLVTPKVDILYGVTRQVVLELADPIFPIEVRDLQLNELRQANEIFITASTKEIMPVREVDGIMVGEGVCGPNTRRLIEMFRDMIRRFVEH
jgi:branched-chain amino acid aminotransferase